MSPRSEEMWEQALGRLTAARASMDGAFPEAAISSAYYAMLYAARAALSEENLHAKTHSGTWNRFWQTFATAGRFDSDLAAEARKAHIVREGADYDAVAFSKAEAEAILDLAERFIAAVSELIGD